MPALALLASMPTEDAARFLAASPDRRRILALLAERPAAPADCADELDVSRRSVQRHLSAFADRGWVEKRDGDYHLTVAGRLVTDEHAAYVDALARVERFGPLYRYLPDEAHAPDPRWLDDARLTVADDADPQAPVHHYVECARNLDGPVRMLSPVLSRLFHDAHADLALKGIHTDLVLDGDTIDRARERNPVEFKVVTSVDVLDLYRHPDGVEVGLTVGADRALVCAYDDGGRLQACLETDDADALAWATDLFERYRDRSERVESSLSLPFSLG